MSQIHPGVMLGTKLQTDKLTKGELAALYLAVVAEFDPRPVKGYEKVRGLFALQEGTRMHSDTFMAFEAIVQERVG